MEWDGQKSSGPPTPSSLSGLSCQSNNSNSKIDKTPTLQQIPPSPSVSALSKLNDDDLRRKGTEDLVRILRKVEADYKSLLGEHGHIVKDVNRRYQIFLLELRGLKENNQKLQDDNQELRDLCCFLDDDRQRGRKLAREWQRFGRYTASVMRSEVAVYQEKLKSLEERQSELVMENMELKELCLFLDQERVRMTGDRDEGDGSSNGTATGHEDGVVTMDVSESTLTSTENILTPGQSIGSTNYIRDLEMKVHRLEKEKRMLAQKMNKTNGFQDLNIILGENEAQDSTLKNQEVLQVHEELEKIPFEEQNLDDTEKAIVREMCNVVWRKLGDVGDVGNFNESSDSVLDPPSIPQPNIGSNTGPLVQGQAHSFNVTQPQPQMASTPLALGDGRPPPPDLSKLPKDDQAAGGLAPHKFHHPMKFFPESSHKPPTFNSQGVLPLNSNVHNKVNNEGRQMAHPRQYDVKSRRPNEGHDPYQNKAAAQQEPEPPPYHHSHNQHSKYYNASSKRYPLQTSQPSDLPNNPAIAHSPPHSQPISQQQHPPTAVPRRSHTPTGQDERKTYKPHNEPSSYNNEQVPEHQPIQKYPQQPQISQAYPPHSSIQLLEAPGTRSIHSHANSNMAKQKSATFGDSRHGHFSRPPTSVSDSYHHRPENLRTNDPGQIVPTSRAGGRSSSMSKSPVDISDRPSAPVRGFDYGADPRGYDPSVNQPYKPRVDSISSGHRGMINPSNNQHNERPGPPQSAHGSRGMYQPLSPSSSHPPPITNPSGQKYYQTYIEPTVRDNYRPGHASSSGKTYPEQEWRQTYLDDSDTL